jgi:hypothetical protein
MVCIESDITWHSFSQSEKAFAGTPVATEMELSLRIHLNVWLLFLC